MALSFSTICRGISTFRVLRESMSKPFEAPVVSAHSQDAYKIWKRIFFVICLPATALGMVNVYVTPEHDPPEFKNYSHLRIRRKKFPWRDGNKSLFHNPHRNALPNGYEVDIHAGHH